MGQVMAIPRRDLRLNILISSKSNPWAAILFKLLIAGKEKNPVKKWWFLTQLVHRMVRQTLSEHDGWWEDKSRKQCSSTLCFSLESQTGQSTEKNYLLSTKTKAKLKQMQAIVSWLLGNGYHSKNKLKTAQAKTSPGTFLIPALSGQQKLLLVVAKIHTYWATKQGTVKQSGRKGWSFPHHQKQACVEWWCSLNTLYLESGHQKISF